MGMDLKGPAGDFWWDVFSWHKLLRLAKGYGWRPAGTTLSEEELQYMPGGVWAGEYTSNDDQMVSAADALNLATALESALPDIPETDVLGSHRTESGGIVVAPNPPDIADIDWFCGPDSKEHIRAFIRYCRRGAFKIG